MSTKISTTKGGDNGLLESVPSSSEFSKFERKILAGGHAIVKGWADAYNEGVRLFEVERGLASRYAKLAAVQDGVTFTEQTIRVNVGIIARAVAAGVDVYRLASMGEVREATAAAAGKPKASHVQVSPFERAYSLVDKLSTAEQRKLVRTLAKALGLTVS